MAEAYYYRGLARMQLKKNAEAKADFRKALELAPGRSGRQGHSRPAQVDALIPPGPRRRRRGIMGGLRGRGHHVKISSLLALGMLGASLPLGRRRGRAGARSGPRDRRGLAGRGPGARPGPGRQAGEGPRGQRLHAPRRGPQAGDRGLRRRRPRGARRRGRGRAAPGAGAAAIPDPLRLLLRAAQGGRRRASGGPRFRARRAGQLATSPRSRCTPSRGACGCS